MGLVIPILAAQLCASVLMLNRVRVREEFTTKGAQQEW
jgi:hypothetical protein